MDVTYRGGGSVTNGAAGGTVSAAYIGGYQGGIYSGSSDAVTVTTGLMKGLNDREMEAVLGHELTHIRNGDVQLMVIAVIIAGVVGFVAELVFRVFQGGARIGGGWSSSSSSSGGWGSSSRSSSGGSSDSKGGGAIVVLLLAAALIALAWFLSQVVRLALSRSRELMADAGSVELTKDPDAMISALRKIENRGELPGATSAVMEMCIDNPREGFSDLFATHPSIDARVRALVTYAGGHDPEHAVMPVALARDDAGVARGIEIPLHPGLDFLTEAALDGLALAVLAIEAVGDKCGFPGIVGEEEAAAALVGFVGDDADEAAAFERFEGGGEGGAVHGEELRDGGHAGGLGAVERHE